jgi:hypothetical protein
MDLAIAKEFVLPEDRIPAILQFNTITGAFVTALTGDIETLGGKDFFTYVEADWNFTHDTVIGNYPDYHVVDTRQLPTKIYESSLDMIARDKITKEYPVIQQVNILGRAITKLSEALGIEQEEMTELLSYIAQVKQTNAVTKQEYQESPDYDYISIEQEAADYEATLEGGVHELYGARAATGGRVF